MRVILESLLLAASLVTVVLSATLSIKARSAVRLMKADAAAGRKLMEREVSGWKDLAFAHADLAEEWRSLGNPERAAEHEDEARTCGRVAGVLQDTLAKL